jgi:hypothetical protein
MVGIKLSENRVHSCIVLTSLQKSFDLIKSQVVFDILKNCQPFKAELLPWSGMKEVVIVN